MHSEIKAIHFNLDFVLCSLQSESDRFWNHWDLCSSLTNVKSSYVTKIGRINDALAPAAIFLDLPVTSSIFERYHYRIDCSNLSVWNMTIISKRFDIVILYFKITQASQRSSFYPITDFYCTSQWRILCFIFKINND